MWVTAWSLKDADKIDQIVNTAKEHKFNQIFVQTRYRADALYMPNKQDTSFKNTETTSYILAANKSFDPLERMILKCREENIEVHAWVTVFVGSNGDVSKLPFAHLWYQHPEWFTYMKNGKKMNASSHEGAFVDPGIPQVQDYLLNIFKDIVSNYEISGFQLDYIRYPDSLSGFNPLALEYFTSKNMKDFHQWKTQNITSFVEKCYKELKNIRPNLSISAAVIADSSKAYNMYSQNWNDWLNKNIVDKVYLMAYNTSQKSFQRLIHRIEKSPNRDKMVVGIKAWNENENYSEHKINEKIKILKKQDFNDIGYYSYAGMKDGNFFEKIKF